MNHKQLKKENLKDGRKLPEEVVIEQQLEDLFLELEQIIDSKNNDESQVDTEWLVDNNRDKDQDNAENID